MVRVTAPMPTPSEEGIGDIPFGDIVLIGMPAGLLRELAAEAARRGIPLAVALGQAIGQYVAQIRARDGGG